MKASAKIKAGLTEILRAKAANKRDRIRVIEKAVRFVMTILSLLLATTLHLQCKSTSTEPEAPIPPPQNQSFKAIGDLPGGRVHSEALGISDDGKVIIGRSSSARFEEEGFFRTVRDSLIVLQGPAGTPMSSEARE